MNVRTIVCPIDVSPMVTWSVAQALALARRHHADVHVVHVFLSRAGSGADHTTDA